MSNSGPDEEWEDLTPGSGGTATATKSDSDWEDVNPSQSVATAAQVSPPNPITHRASMRNAQAQPGITPAMRAASPVNKGVMTGLNAVEVAAPFAIPGAEVAEAGSLKPLIPYGRGLLKAAAGSELGRYGGRAIGSMFGDKGAEVGGQVGSIAGGVAGPFIGGKTFAKAPFGIGRVLASDEDYAAAQTARKVAQRNSDIAAGLRKPPIVAPPFEQEGGFGAPLPEAPTPDEKLAQAVKEGRAANLPIKMPRQQVAGPEVDPVAAAVKNRTASWIPTKVKPAAGELVGKPSPFEGMISSNDPNLPRTPVGPPTEGPATTASGPPAEIVPKGSKRAAEIEEGIKGSIAKPSGRLILTPEEARASEQMQKIATKRASEHGMQYAAGMRPAGGGRVPMTPTGTVTPEFGGPRESIPIPAPRAEIGPPKLMMGPDTPVASPMKTMPSVDKLADAIQEQTGTDRLNAAKRAEHLINAATGEKFYNGAERRIAPGQIAKYMGKDRRQ